MSDFLKELNNEQRKAAECTEGAVLLLAGAGSGKTRVLTHRIAHIISSGLAYPSQILAITFTNKAANEMKHRLDRMTGEVSSMWVCTIHGMCVRILRSNAELLGGSYNKNFSIYSTVDSDRVLKRVIIGLGHDPEKELKSARWHISNAKNNNHTPDSYAQAAPHNIDRLLEIFRAYESELARSNAMDFDDLLMSAYRLLKNNPEAAERYQKKFKYIHIDEFQDTNAIQYELIKILAGGYGNIFAVGDDDQSIYSFRGAVVENIFRFQKQYPDVTVLKLEQNYRSTKNILDAANLVIAKNTSRMPKTLWTENDSGVRVECVSQRDEQSEAAYVAAQIYALKSSGYSYGDFAVLIRINALSRSFEQEFLKYNIPSKVYGGFKFFERKEVKDIISYLRVITNPYDSESLLRIINTPRRGLGDTAVARLREYAEQQDITLFDAVMDAEQLGLRAQATSGLLRFKDVLMQLITDAQLLPLEEFAARAVEITGIRGMYASGSDEDRDKNLNIDEFIAALKLFAEDNPGAQVTDFVQAVTLQSADDEDSGDSVTIATVHAVKGLEFKVVFVCGLEEKIFPILRNDSTDTDMEEERRLMYVAMTRAKKRLYLTHAHSRFMYGDRAVMLQSTFFSEVKKHVTPEEVVLSGFDEAGPASPTRVRPASARFGGAPVQRPARKSTVDLSAFVPGAKVSHPKFGEGVIMDVTGSGLSRYAEVAFRGIGIMKFSLQFAPLTVKD